MSKNKIIITILAIITIALIAITLIMIQTSSKKEDPQVEQPTIETNGILLPDVDKKNINYKNATIIYENGESTINLTITNKSKKEIELELIKIKLYDENNKIIKEIKGYVGKKLKENESTTLTAKTTYDLRKAKNIEYEY